MNEAWQLAVRKIGNIDLLIRNFCAASKRWRRGSHDVNAMWNEMKVRGRKKSEDKKNYIRVSSHRVTLFSRQRWDCRAVSRSEDTLTRWGLTITKQKLLRSLGWTGPSSKIKGWRKEDKEVSGTSFELPRLNNQYARTFLNKTSRLDSIRHNKKTELTRKQNDWTTQDGTCEVYKT